MHNGGASSLGLVQPLPEHLPEGQQGVWGVGDAVVWPGHIVELTHVENLLLLRLDRGCVGGERAQNARGCFLTGRGIPGAHWGSLGECWKVRLPGEFCRGHCLECPGAGIRG